MHSSGVNTCVASVKGRSDERTNLRDPRVKSPKNSQERGFLLCASSAYEQNRKTYRYAESFSCMYIRQPRWTNIFTLRKKEIRHASPPPTSLPSSILQGPRESVCECRCTYLEVPTSKNVNHDPGSTIDIEVFFSFTEISNRGMWFLASGAASFLYLALPAPPSSSSSSSCFP
ncbi:hypothetical protein BDP81DRAFT_13050 [Colletotrichum phormii]|uniref:Uncharacterized protein n=1 Tax=Colletotrichum phormii TaxID=359342 RepID=A0AAJ0A3T1_9PEZI|nr:uncharacterized protein BDP81DRAFT_13050 [Colletotrichum phormii]KAK1655955.1 hypothetical protein BDP81DRAFT_13050 [Colletotrichum phormii]